MLNCQYGALKNTFSGYFVHRTSNMFVICVQIQRLRKHLHQTQRQSGLKDSFKLPVCVPYQQTEGQHLGCFYLSVWSPTSSPSNYTFFSTAAKWLYLCLYPSSNAISLVWPAVLKIMMLSDPEVESAVLISSDEGASFEKHPINFKILSLLFHPAQENWILAYSDDSKVTSESMNFWVEIRWYTKRC